MTDESQKAGIPMWGFELRHIFQRFLDDLTACWDGDTAADKRRWERSACPAQGQCAVTALCVQDILGGDLLHGEVNGESHYWNRTEGGMELDFTAEQFPLDSEATAPIVVRERDYVLSFPDTVKRYDLLKAKLADRGWYR